jgi:nitrogen fixation/metabolism regulation signal transduction histidine kinase
MANRSFEQVRMKNAYPFTIGRGPFWKACDAKTLAQALHNLIDHQPCARCAASVYKDHPT